MEENIHSEIRKYLWPEVITFCCGTFCYNETDMTVTYTFFTDKLNKTMEWKNRIGNKTQLGMFVVPIIPEY